MRNSKGLNQLEAKEQTANFIMHKCNLHCKLNFK